MDFVFAVCVTRESVCLGRVFACVVCFARSVRIQGFVESVNNML